jgi:DtxR family transcriptional regulator, Mn-dependent transcriptional regulator
MPTESMDEYIEAIYRLGGDAAPVSVGDVAQRLAVSVVSANEMVKRLAQRGLAEYEPYRGILLTGQGTELALRVLRCHRLWERFLTDTLGLPWDLVHDEACRLEHVTSPLVEKRLAAFLGEPTHCPHGSRVPAAGSTHESRDSLELCLAALKPGQCAVVTRVSVEEPDLLRYVDELGLRPDAVIEVESVAPFAGPITLRVEGNQRVIGGQIATVVYVEVVQ